MNLDQYLERKRQLQKIIATGDEARLKLKTSYDPTEYRRLNNKVRLGQQAKAELRGLSCG